MIRRIIKQGKPSLKGQAADIDHLIEEKELERDKLIAWLVSNVLSKDFDQKKRDLDIVGNDIEVLEEKKLKILGRFISKDDIPEHITTHYRIGQA